MDCVCQAAMGIHFMTVGLSLNETRAPDQVPDALVLRNKPVSKVKRNACKPARGLISFLICSHPSMTNLMLQST